MTGRHDYCLYPRCLSYLARHLAPGVPVSTPTTNPASFPWRPGSSSDWFAMPWSNLCLYPRSDHEPTHRVALPAAHIYLDTAAVLSSSARNPPGSSPFGEPTPCSRSLDCRGFTSRQFAWRFPLQELVIGSVPGVKTAQATARRGDEYRICSSTRYQRVLFKPTQYGYIARHKRQGAVVERGTTHTDGSFCRHCPLRRGSGRLAS